MSELWILRHGQTDWNLLGRWQGQARHAPGLNDTGRAQALAARKALADVPLAAVYSSDLLRCVQTAEIVVEDRGLEIYPEPRLREINLGAWEGMFSDEIEARYPQEMAEREREPFVTRAPDGESPSDVVDRVMAAVAEIVTKHPAEPVLVVGHGVSLAVILCRARGIPFHEIYDHIPENAQPQRVAWA